MEKDVWTVMIRVGDEIRSGDMVFRDGQAYLVWEWHEQASNEHPGITIPLDGRFLQKVDGAGGFDFVYNQPIQEPDSAS